MDGRLPGFTFRIRQESLLKENPSAFDLLPDEPGGDTGGERGRDLSRPRLRPFAMPVRSLDAKVLSIRYMGASCLDLIPKDESPGRSRSSGALAWLGGRFAFTATAYLDLCFVVVV